MDCMSIVRGDSALSAYIVESLKNSVHARQTWSEHPVPPSPGLLSLVGAIMSFGYSFIAFGLSIAQGEC